MRSEEAKMGLEENLKLGIQVAKKVRLNVQNSSNTGYTSSPVKTTSGSVVNAVSSIDAVRPSGTMTRPTTPFDWLESFNGIRDRCTKHGMGNCGELAAIACLFLREAKAFPVDYVEIADGVTRNPAIPHLVAVIGRTVIQGPHAWPRDDTNIGLPDTWHADAVICDPWDRVAYAAQDYDAYWGGLRMHSQSPGNLRCTLVHQI
jgi:hypothetical protein